MPNTTYVVDSETLLIWYKHGSPHNCANAYTKYSCKITPDGKAKCRWCGVEHELTNFLLVAARRHTTGFYDVRTGCGVMAANETLF